MAKNDIENQQEFEETERQDKEMVERWKDEADSILLFAGLFSAVGVVTLVESYKWLSPDSGDETVELLAQLVNVTQNIPLTSSEPFKRTFDIVAVNIFLFTSVTICIFCAVFATLIQQWAQRYLALSQGRGTPEERARVREFLYKGIRRFQMTRVCQLLLMALHVSIAFFILGVIIFVFHIDRNLATVGVLIPSLSIPIYTVVTFLPIFFLDSPYSTPFSAPAWRIWHFWLAVIFSICSSIANRFSPNVNYLQTRADEHRQRCVDGLKRSVERYAKTRHA